MYLAKCHIKNKAGQENGNSTRHLIQLITLKVTHPPMNDLHYITAKSQSQYNRGTKASKV